MYVIIEMHVELLAYKGPFFMRAGADLKKSHIFDSGAEEFLTGCQENLECSHA